MNKKVPSALYFLSFIMVFFLLTSVQCQNIQQTENLTLVPVYPPWLNSSETEYNQFLADRYNYFISPMGNKVWACGMSLAWSQLKRGILNGQNPAFLNSSSLQQKLVDNLNEELFKKSELSDDSYYVASGFGPQTLDRINLQVREKFPSKTFLPLEEKMAEKDFISYAYLYKSFKFQQPFKKLEYFGFNDKPVAGFEASTSKLRNQVYQKYFNNTEDFMIGLETNSPNDEILLWKTNQTGVKEAKLEKILSMIKFYSSLPSTKLTQSDQFMMPVVDVDYQRNYKEMQNAQFTNSDFEGYQIGKMKENIKVKVMNAGVSFENQAVVFGFRSGFYFGKEFILNSDFWLIMKQKNRLPYLVMLVRNVSQKAQI